MDSQKEVSVLAFSVKPPVLPLETYSFPSSADLPDFVSRCHALKSMVKHKGRALPDLLASSRLDDTRLTALKEVCWPCPLSAAYLIYTTFR
jgi:hypothetical protein